MAHDIEKNKQVVWAFGEAINSRDWERLDNLVAVDFIRHSNAAPGVHSREDLKRYLRSEFEIFPDRLRRRLNANVRSHERISQRSC
jgi:hypothetical protein